jgi:hypothetical protein
LTTNQKFLNKKLWCRGWWIICCFAHVKGLWSICGFGSCSGPFS